MVDIVHKNKRWLILNLLSTASNSKNKRWRKNQNQKVHEIYLNPIEVNENSGLRGSLSKQPSVLTVRVPSFGVRSIGGR